MKLQLKNEIYTGANNRKSVYDLNIPEDFNGKILLFIHGYKGFKDWGAWQMMENQIVEKGFGFCKFNLSHNGGTVEHPLDFPDMEAFSENCFSYQVEDTQMMIAILNEKYPKAEIILMGHSRGGGIALLCGRNTKVKAVITLAAVCSFERRFSNKSQDLMNKWKKEGVRYELNTRTKENMPQKYMIYEDFLENRDLLNVEIACRTFEKPCLHFHGFQDEAIQLDEANNIACWTKSPLYILDECNHTFNISHPWKNTKISNSLQFVVDKTLSFLKEI